MFNKKMSLTWFATFFLSAVVVVFHPAYGETFSLAIIADPHINGNPDHKARFETAVNWIISHKDDKEIELAFVLGDIGWGGPRKNRNLRIAKGILDRLNDAGIPYIPVLGDNEIQTGCEKEFQEIFAPQYTLLSMNLDNWKKSAVAVDNLYLQNFSFDYKECHFICPDFNSRKAGDEGGALHDFKGGSWPWFKNDIRQCQKSKKENVLILTHIGLLKSYGERSRKIFCLTTDEIEASIIEKRTDQSGNSCYVKIKVTARPADFIKAEIRNLALDEEEKNFSWQEEMEQHVYKAVDPGLELSRAYRYFRKKQWRLAFIYLDHLEKKYPNWHEIYSAKAIGYYATNNREAMINALKRSCSLGNREACEDIESIRQND